MKILFLSNLKPDLGQPLFRYGSYVRNLIPIARAVAATGRAEVRVLASGSVARKLRTKAAELGVDDAALLSVDFEDLQARGWSDFMVRSYREPVPGDVQRDIGSRIERALNGWRPDVILCWETPSAVLRQFYSEALVLDLMPGLFMRAPYPALISVDPVGIYRDCWYSGVDVASVGASDEALTGFAELRRLYQDHFSGLSVEKAVFEHTGIRVDSSTNLVPLQVERYFAWRDTSYFADQLQLLKAVLADAAADATVVPTRRVGDMPTELALDNRTQDQLRAVHAGFRYHPALEALNNITQYLLPISGSMISVSSTLGLQAKFYGKQLIVPARSHLSYIADGDRVSADAGNRNLDPFMAALVGRTSLFRDRLSGDGTYVLKVIQAFLERRDETGVEQFPPMDVTGTTPQQIAAKSRFNQSSDPFRRAFVGGSDPRSGALKDLERRLLSDEIDTVSFDVFDTLVCRVVLKPADVFCLLGTRVREEFGSVFPAELLDRFDQFRSGMERKLRHRLDRTDGPGAELSIQDVYRQLLATFSLPDCHAEALIALEQEVELGLLVPRSEIVDLFHRVRRAGKRVLILSDFIHGTAFVERVLRQCGVSDWDAIFVSADVGVKKHSGAMFDHVIRALKLVPRRTFHVGDNYRGDIEMARSRGLRTAFTPAAPKTALRLLEQRGVSPVAVSRSVLLGAVLATFAARHLGLGGSPIKAGGSDDLISTPRELGFLAIGPVMYFFTRHLLAQARMQGCSQIVFFARDSRIPFEMARHLLGDAEDITLSYWPVSRAGVSGLDFWRPRDLYKVRIDDFRRDHPLISLLQRRFHLKPQEIDRAALEEWSDTRLEDLKVLDLPEMAVFDLAVRSAESHWSAFFKRVEARRRIFLRGVESWGADLSRKTMTVDIGYTGSIHRMVAGLFAVEPLPAMFMTYADRIGRERLGQADAYYLRAQIPHGRHPDPLICFNLILETLLNEGVGSVVEYEEHVGTVRPVYDGAVDSAHATVVRAIHDGALDFAEYWERNCRSLIAEIEFDPTVLSFFFDCVVRNPTAREIEMLGDLVFDNGFSGHAPRRLIERDARGARIRQGVWKAGARAVAKPAKPPTRPDPEVPARSKVEQVERSPFDFAIGLAILHLRGSDLHERFRRSPAATLASARNPVVRRIGRLIYR